MILSLERTRIGAVRAHELLSTWHAPLRIALSPAEFREAERRRAARREEKAIEVAASARRPIVSSPKPRLIEYYCNCFRCKQQQRTACPKRSPHDLIQPRLPLQTPEDPTTHPSRPYLDLRK